MNTISKRLLFWTPRAICIAFAIFLSLFALDVLSEGYGFWKTLLALLIHLVPVYIVLAQTQLLGVCDFAKRPV
jgi:uncharacterized membrane protein